MSSDQDVSRFVEKKKAENTYLVIFFYIHNRYQQVPTLNAHAQQRHYAFVSATAMHRLSGIRDRLTFDG